MFWIYALCGLLFILCLISIKLFMPSFEKENYYSRVAENYTRSEFERKRLKKGKVTLWLSDKVLPKITQNPFFKLDRLLGKNIKQIIEVMGKYTSVEEMVAMKIVQATVFTSPVISACLVLNGYYIAIPIFFVIFFIKGIHDVKASFAQMQREITKDLPKFIEQMKMALETGKSFVTVFREMEKSCGPKMKLLLTRLNGNLQDMEPSEAIEIFARDTTIPVMLPFATAIKIGINSGYEEGKVYLEDIREELVKLRRTALEEITKSRPQRIMFIKMGIVFFSIGSVIICFVTLFSDILTTF
ncbi:hypothetical protein ABE82_26985 (plasmid) [Paenibacillus peoriae]|uniref:hypothetical protein n=1 Tax=Paenibacillus peoriae TaxID=59893 RepID=UPI00072015E1|nr:hypothetical protein [Paenibacillus peoriae]ALS10051.1 hypothetical protein ABE82_26985 [Paenibacillus peoriae]